MTLLFLKAFIIGLSIAMPIGPIATLLIKNTLERGWKMGFAVGLGAALVEGFYGFVVSGGFVLVSDFVSRYTSEIRLVGGLMLLVLGLREIKNCYDSQVEEIKMKKHGFAKTVFLVSLLTLANPMTMVFFAGVIASMSQEVFDLKKTIIMVLGTFLGSLAWTTGLSFVISIIRHKISQRSMVIIKVASGIMISGFGIYGILGIASS